MLAIAEIDQCMQVPVGDKHYIPTTPPISAAGAAVRNILFPPEGNCTVSSIPAFDIDFGVIIKHIPTSSLVLLLVTELLTDFLYLSQTSFRHVVHTF
jgi:hypothetical protein